MLELRPRHSIGHARHGWLDARHHFSFAGYYDPRRMGWGALRVWNDDAIAPHSGFDTHPHRDMEIITVLKEGAVTHRDGMGNHGEVATGYLQVMSAGTGVRHSEHNEGDGLLRLFQIWIQPDRSGVTPRWETRALPEGDNQVQILASGRPADAGSGAIGLYQDAAVLSVTLSRSADTRDGDRVSAQVTVPLGHGRGLYLVPASGGVVVRQQEVQLTAGEGDGVAASGDGALTLSLPPGVERAQVVMVETVMA